MTPTLAIYDALDCGTLRGFVTVSPDITQTGAAFDLAKWEVGFYANGKKLTDAEANERMDRFAAAGQKPILYWNPNFFNQGWHPSVDPYSPEYIAWLNAKVAEVAKRLEYRTAFHLCDFERPDPFVPSVFSQKHADGKITIDPSKGEQIPVNVPHLATMTHLLHTALCASGFPKPIRGTNYHCSHHAKCPDMGGTPYHRATPNRVPGVFGGNFTLVITYPAGNLTDAEFDDLLERCPRPFGLIIRLDDPKVAARARQAKLAGADIVLLYGGIADGGAWTKVAPNLATEIVRAWGGITLKPAKQAGNWTGGDITKPKAGG